MIKNFWTALSLCHEVIPAEDKNGKIKYRGPSPDEVALVDAAKKYGY